MTVFLRFPIVGAMKFWLLPLAAGIGAAASPAVAQEAPAPAPQFALEQGVDSCSVAGTLPDSAVALATGTDGILWLRASGSGWPPLPEGTFRIRLRPAADSQEEASYDAHEFRDANGWPGVSLRAPTTALRWPLLALYRGEETEPFAVIHNPYPGHALELRNCLTEIARADRGSGKPAAIGPSPRTSPYRLVTSDDYPAAALRAHQSGVTGIRLTVSAHGVPSDCDVTQSSGFALLDSRACELLSRRARFAPARDDAGEPTQGFYASRVRWSLPGEYLPPAPE